MKKYKLIIIILAIITLFYAINYFGFLQRNDIKTSNSSVRLQSRASDEANVKYEVVDVANNLFVPWSIDFTSETRTLVTERSGAIRVIEKDVLLDTPLYEVNNLSKNDEEGLMGLAIDPDYINNKFIYISYAYTSGNNILVKVDRLIDNGSTAQFDKTIISEIPAARFHAGCRIEFGPDNKLYITTGDALEKERAQDIDFLGGKILRINSDGTIPKDNPFENSPVFSYGHRNPQGISWLGDDLYSTEHGPSVFDGPAGGDEINLIKPGGNYGWPVVSHQNSRQGMIDPLRVFTPAVAPASAMVYKGDLFPQFKNKLFFGGLRGEGVYVATISDQTISGVEKLDIGDLGRIREISQSPNGEIYFSTSNQDGRGELQEGDDKIFKITTN